MPLSPSLPEKTKIAVKNLNFYYGKFHALKDISLNIPENKVTAFIGPSGCGKSTLVAHTSTACTSLYPEPTGRGRNQFLDGQNILDAKQGRLELAARPNWHGVSEAHTVPHDHLRQHRIWREVVRKP